jgi:hypothetical protein
MLWHAAVLIVIVALLATGWTLLGRALGPGTAAESVPSDTRLLELAADIGLTITAIDRFHKDTGAYPAKADQFAGRLPQGVIADTAGDTLSIDTGHGTVWSYLRTEDGQGYELTRHLPDGGSLSATCDHGKLTWLYAETDDDDPEPITLPPPN